MSSFVRDLAIVISPYFAPN